MKYEPVTEEARESRISQAQSSQNRRASSLRRIIVCLWLTALVASQARAFAESGLSTGVPPAQILVRRGHAVTLTCPCDVDAVASSDPKTVDAIQLTDSWISLIGGGLGSAEIKVTCSNQNVRTFRAEVVGSDAERSGKSLRPRGFEVVNAKTTIRIGVGLTAIVQTKDLNLIGNADSKVVDIHSVSSHELVLEGKLPGDSTVTVLSSGRKSLLMFDVKVVSEAVPPKAVFTSDGQLLVKEPDGTLKVVVGNVLRRTAKGAADELVVIDPSIAEGHPVSESEFEIVGNREGITAILVRYYDDKTPMELYIVEVQKAK